MTEEDWKKFNERNLSEKKAHRLVERLCESKNIELTLRQEGKTGHCEIAEIWTFAEKIPVTASDLRILEQNSALRFSKIVDKSGSIFINEFSRGAGWVVYELESGKNYYNG